MGSKGGFPPHPYWRPNPVPGIGHHDSIPREMHPQQHGGYPPFDMLPRPEIMEQKLAAQHVEMQKLATENKRFAATHGTLRQDLAAIQHELQMLHNHVGAVKSEREQQITGLLDKIGKMEADLRGTEVLKVELHNARSDAQSLVSARDELVSRVKQLTDEYQRVHVDLQQVPALVTELESLRQEYQHSRATYDYEKKLYNEHLESLQVMEKNYMTMATEVEKLRAELKKHAEIDRRTAVGPYAGFAGHHDNESSGHYPAVADGNGPAGAQSGPAAVRTAYDPYRVPGPAGPGYDTQRVPGPAGPGYDVQRGPGGLLKGPGAVAPAYDSHRGPVGPGYDSYRGQRGPGAQRGPTYDGQRGPQFGGPGYDVTQGQAVTAHGGGGFQVQPPPAAGGGNHPGRR